jgi:hypothetical protein
MHAGKYLAMLFHLICAEQFRSQGRFIAGAGTVQAGFEKMIPESRHGSASGRAAYFHMVMSPPAGVNYPQATVVSGVCCEYVGVFSVLF